jgi:hypothetical protein
MRTIFLVFVLVLYEGRIGKLGFEILTRFLILFAAGAKI